VTRARDLLSSSEAKELIWFFRWAASEMGFRAANMEGGTGGGDATAKTWKSQRAMDAVPRERRVRAGLAQLGQQQQETLRIAYEGKRHSPEIHEALGDFADLAMKMPAAREAHAQYVAKWKPRKLGEKQPYSLETWLVISAKHGSEVLPVIRTQVEEHVRRALDAFSAVFEPEPHEPAPPKERAPRGPNKEHGTPFIAREPTGDHR
jgi:hypothetical protein